MAVIVLERQPADLKAVLAAIGEGEGFASAQEAEARIAKGGVHAVVVSLATPGAADLSLRLKRRAVTALLPVIAIVWRDGLYDEIVAHNCRADAFVAKKDIGALAKIVRETKAQAPHELYPSFVVGQSETMVELLGLVQKVAPTPMNVLIEGESGSGKDVLARVIHVTSKLKAAPFVAVNCAAIPAALLESEFFGHVKGSFTDAKSDRAGFFDVADGGTLFLDEIGELPLEFQAKLLRSVESGEVRAIGSSQPKRVTVRIVSATNRTLAQEVEAGRFRQDLFFRLQQFHLRMPSLHERREDLPALVDHFLHDQFATLNPAVSEIDPKALDLLATYRFPGNIRELRNLLQSLKVVAEPPKIRLEDMPRYIRAGAAPSTSPKQVQDERLDAEILTLEVDLSQGLKTVMTEVMAKVLRAYVALAGGIIKDAATLAKVPLPTWYRKVREADLTREIPE